MKCDKILETMPDLAAGIMAATPEMNEHLRSCPACNQTGRDAENDGSARRVASSRAIVF